MTDEPRGLEGPDDGEPGYPRPDSGPPRAPWAWAVLAVLFVLLISMRFLTPDPQDKSGFDQGETDSSLRMALIAKEAAAGLSGAGAEKVTTGLQRRDLTELRDKLKAHEGKVPAAAKYSLAVGRELGDPPSERALELLENGKDPADRLFAEAYRDGPLDQASLAKFKSALPEGFLGKLAKAQAESKASGRLVKAVGQSEVMSAALGAVLVALVVLGGLLVWVLSPVIVKGLDLAGILERTPKPNRSEGDRWALRMAVFIVFFLTLMIAVPALIGGRLLQGVATVIAYVVLVAVLALFSAQPVLDRSDPLGQVIGRKGKAPWLVLTGGLAFLANIPVVFATAIAGSLLFPNLPKPHHPVTEMVGSDLNPVTVACLFTMVGVMAPIVEEISFRGYLFRGLLAYVRPIGAMALSGLLFAAIHPQGVLLWLPLGLVGAMGALLTYWTQSLVPAMVMHGLHNTFLMIVAFAILGT